MPCTIHSLAPWAGNKRTLAADIVALLGRHRVYIEPFAGGMAVLPSKPVTVVEVLNDLHDGIINAARAVADPESRRLVLRRLAAILHAEREHADARDWLRIAPAPHVGRQVLPDIEHAARSLTLWWQGRSGEAGCAEAPALAVRYTDGSSPARRWLAMQRSLHALGARLSNATLLCRDGFALLRLVRARADNPDTAIYVDPPYVDKAIHYRHDFDLVRHEHLADLLSSFRRARIVVSYYDHPLVRLLYPERIWRWVIPQYTPTHTNVSAPASRGRRPSKVEVLLCRGGAEEPQPSPAGGADKEGA